MTMIFAVFDEKLIEIETVIPNATPEGYYYLLVPKQIDGVPLNEPRAKTYVNVLNSKIVWPDEPKKLIVGGLPTIVDEPINGIRHKLEIVIKHRFKVKREGIKQRLLDHVKGDTEIEIIFADVIRIFADDPRTFEWLDEWNEPRVIDVQ